MNSDTPRTDKEHAITSDDEAFTGWTAFSCMTRHARTLERENNKLRAENQRLFDLVRYQRSELHEAELISDDEYMMLLADSKSKGRLETYDQLRADLKVCEEDKERMDWLCSRPGLLYYGGKEAQHDDLRKLIDDERKALSSVQNALKGENEPS